MKQLKIAADGRYICAYCGYAGTTSGDAIQSGVEPRPAGVSCMSQRDTEPPRYLMRQRGRIIANAQKSAKPPHAMASRVRFNASPDTGCTPQRTPLFPTSR